VASPPPIRTNCFIKYLKLLGCSEDKGTKHNKWKCPNSLRSIIFDRDGKEIPYLHVQTNLRNLGVTMSTFKKWAKDNC